ncbi:hypothetical protein Tco_0260475 [Tanacetum coccineum]
MIMLRRKNGLLMVAAQEIDFLFKVNFLTLFTNTMAKADGLKGQICLDVVRRLREDSVISDINWCGYIYDSLRDSKLPGGTNHYLGPLTFLITKLRLQESEVFYWFHWTLKTSEKEGFVELSRAKNSRKVSGDPISYLDVDMDVVNESNGDEIMINERIDGNLGGLGIEEERMMVTKLEQSEICVLKSKIRLMILGNENGSK